MGNRERVAEILGVFRREAGPGGTKVTGRDLKYADEILAALTEGAEPVAWALIGNRAGRVEALSQFEDLIDKNRGPVVPLFTAPPSESRLRKALEEISTLLIQVRFGDEADAAEEIQAIIDRALSATPKEG